MSDAEIMAMSGMADAALQVAGNITASSFNYRHTKELAEFQNDMNVANWKMANEYNSPKNQMARFAEAGLNPNLMYGQGTPGNASSISSPTLQNMNYKNPFAGISLAQMYEQTKGLALQNEQREVALDQQKMKEFDQVRKQTALGAFIYDHIDHSKFDYSGFALRFGKRGRVEYVEGAEARSYFAEARHTPEYKQLELLWQKGLLNEGNIGLLTSRNALVEAQTGVLSFNEEKNKLLMEVLQGDTSDDNLKKLFALVLLNLLESSTSSGVLSTILK